MWKCTDCNKLWIYIAHFPWHNDQMQFMCVNQQYDDNVEDQATPPGTMPPTLCEDYMYIYAITNHHLRLQA